MGEASVGPGLPAWAEEMRQVFKAGAQPVRASRQRLRPRAGGDGKGGVDWLSLNAFLAGTMFRRSTSSSATTAAAA